MKKNISSVFVLALVAVLSVFASCNKLSNRTSFVYPPGNTPVVTPDSVILKAGIIVIDSNRLTLVSSTDQLNSGVYVYTSSTGFPTFIADNIIIGITGEGYLRKVTSVVTQSGRVTLSTVQAKLEDVFAQANINFSTDVDNLARKTSAGYQYNGSNISLFDDGTASVSLVNDTININPNWNFNMQFLNGAMTGFSAICNNGTLDAHAQISVTSSGADNIAGSKTLNPVSGRTIIWIGQLPIVVSTYLSFATTVTGNVSGSIKHTFGFTTSDNYTIGNTYSSGSWMNHYSYSHVSSITDSPVSGYNLSCSIAPQMTLKIYGIACPSASNALNTIETSDSTFAGGFTAQQTFSVWGNILGYGVPDNSFTRNTDTVSYLQAATGYSFVKISGDGQIGTAYQYLAAPIVVRVIDNNGAGQAGVTVDFTVTNGGGLLSYYSVTTNSNGYAQTNWQIGNPATSSQNVQAVARTTGGVQIGSALNFIAL